MTREHVLCWCARAIALACLAVLALVRLWAVLGGRIPGKAIALTALALALLCVFLVVRFRLWARFLTPFETPWKNALLSGSAFLLGAFFDLSYAMTDASGLLIGTLPVRLLCHAGSGLLFAAIVLALVKAARSFGSLPRVDGRVMLVLALGLNVLAAVYIAGSATVYAWDTAGYWTVAGNLSQAPLGLAQLREVLESTITLDYNYLLAFPISLLMRLFGTGRYIFILGIVNFYLLPAAWGLCVLGRRLGKRGGVLLVLALPMLAYNALVGFVDVAAAGAAIWAVAIYTDRERDAEARGMLAGALLVLSFLLRRYFIFFAGSFGAAALLANLLCDRKKWRGFLTLGCSAAVCAAFFTQSFLVEKILAVNYGDIYSAYAQGLRNDVMIFSRYFGVIYLVLALVLGLFLLLRRKALRWQTALVLFQLAACFLLLSRVQSHGQQHLLLYAPGLAFLLAEGVAALPAPRWKGVCAWAVAGAATLSAFVPRPQPSSPAEIKYPAPIPSFTFASPVREDIGQLIALRSYVDSLAGEAGKSVAVVASSLSFNGDTYLNVYQSMGIPEAGPQARYVYMSTVDKRDAFSWNVLAADYLVVADPVQTHLGEENQQIMALVAHDVLDGTGLGTAYRRLDQSFRLAGGARAYVYERMRDLTAEEYRSVSDRLTALYPDYAEQYKSPY